MLLTLIRAFNRLQQIIKIYVYRLFYKELNIDPLKSYFSGKVIIKNKGCIYIDDGFKGREGSILNANGGVIKIGTNVFFNRNVSINAREEVIIGNSVLIGEDVKLYDHDHDFRFNAENIANHFIREPIHIGDNVWIGCNVIILRGVRIGNNCIIGAGCVVTKDVPSDTVLIQKRESTFTDINM